MPPKSKVELFAAIRRDSRTGQLSIRALARKYNVHRRVVRQALTSAWPAPRKQPASRRSVLDPYKDFIDVMLREDLEAPPKQRHTARRVFTRLVEEHAMTEVSYGRVRDYVRLRRPEIWAEAGRGPAREVFIEHSHQPGRDAEVDFGDAEVILRGEKVRCYLFSFRLSFSGKAVHRISASCGQEAFMEGHVHAFETLGGVPAGLVRYDNLSSAVAQVLGVRSRRETDRWTAFRSHYQLEAFYCRPGKVGAHEKGGVEGDVGFFRRNCLVPVPKVDSLAELNERIAAFDAADEDRRIGSRTRTIGQYFSIEAPLLTPLPDELFETGRYFTPRVDRRAQITVRTNRYSVPAYLIGRQVQVMLHGNDLIVYDQRTLVARHERLGTQGGRRLELDHYLEVLMRKPAALPGASALEQARASGRFTAVHEAWWARARAVHGEAAGTRELIEVLLLHRRMPHAHVVAGLAAALAVDALTADAVALEARKTADGDPGATPATPPHEPGRPVVSLTERRLTALPPDTRPLPSVAAYDQLLKLPRPSSGTER